MNPGDNDVSRSGVLRRSTSRFEFERRGAHIADAPGRRSDREPCRLGRLETRKPQRIARLSTDAPITGGGRRRQWTGSRVCPCFAWPRPRCRPRGRLRHLPPRTRQCASRAASMTDLRRSPYDPFPIVQADSKTCILKILVLPQLSIVRPDKPAGAPQMLRQRSSNASHAKHSRSCRIVSAVLTAALMAAVTWIDPTATFAQATSPGTQSARTHTTSPLARRSGGIPLGSTEIATPGIGPVVPSQGELMGTCASSDGAGPSGAFDGGGMSGTSSLSCADSRNISSPLPSPSSIGRIGIPLGATEIGGAGISPAAPVAGPGLSSGVDPAGSPSTTTNSGNP
jgi:hypothetical protein